MYKYKDKEFDIIEMTHEDSPFNWSLPTTYGHITMESLEAAIEAAIDEVFTVREDTPRITRRRSGMSAMASAVEIQRTIGIP